MYLSEISRLLRFFKKLDNKIHCYLIPASTAQRISIDLKSNEKCNRERGISREQNYDVRTDFLRALSRDIIFEPEIACIRRKRE